MRGLEMRTYLNMDGNMHGKVVLFAYQMVHIMGTPNTVLKFTLELLKTLDKI